jgi:hypothetical protein
VEICTAGSVRGEGVGAAMVNLNGHEAGNGGHSQGTPNAHRPLSYSETHLHRLDGPKITLTKITGKTNNYRY